MPPRNWGVVGGGYESMKVGGVRVELVHPTDAANDGMPRHHLSNSSTIEFRSFHFRWSSSLASRTRERAEKIKSEQACRSMGCKKWPMIVKDSDVSVTVKIGRGCRCTR